MRSVGRKIAFTGIFTAIGIVLNLFSFSVPPMGRASLVYLSCYLAGIVLGPWLGFTASFAADFLPAVVAPQGPWMPLISLSIGLTSLLTGLIFRYVKWKNFFLKLLLSAVVCFVVCTLGVGALGAVPLLDVYYPSAKALGESLGITSPFLMISLSKAINQPFWIAVNVILTCLVYVPLKKLLDRRGGESAGQRKPYRF